MPTADVQLSFAADASSLQDALQPLQDALAALQASFADTSAISGWSQAVSASAQTAAASVGAAAQTMQDALTTRLDPIGAGVSKLFTGLISGGETFGQAFGKLGEQMLARFVGWTAQMAEQWAVGELTQTAASTSGAAARTAVAAAAQASGLAASGAQALADIGNSAARAAAGAFAAVAATPVIGPALAPAAAATALAAALEFGGQVVSAAGGWGQVPYDGALASLHKDEMVLPSSIASPLRSAVGGWSLGEGSPGTGSGSALGASGGRSAGGGGGGATHHHWNIQAVDAASFARMAKSNPEAITGALTSASQRLSLTAGKLGGRAR